MDERMRRQWAAAESRAYGWGGVRAVSTVTGMSPNTIRKGLAELAVRDENPDAPVEPALRRTGAGRKRRTETDPELLDALEGLVEPTTRGDPESALRWTCKSTTLLARELTRQRHPVSARTVGDCSTNRATACRATARRAKVAPTPIAMPSSSTSTRA